MVNAGYGETKVSEAGAGNQTDVAGTDDGYFHKKLLSVVQGARCKVQSASLKDKLQVASKERNKLRFFQRFN